MNASFIMRLLATFAFLLATFGTPIPVVALVPLGLALWCCSTLLK